MARKSNQKRKTTDRNALSERSRWARLLTWMLERIKAGLRHVVHFLWEWSWTFSIPVGVILAMTLWSYSADDPAFSVSTSKSPDNLCGLWGAWAADLLFGAFGLSAWWVVPGFFMIAVFAIRSQLRRARGETDPERINPPKFSACVGFLALMLGSTGLEALRLRRFEVVLPAHSGGVLGHSLGTSLEYYVGLGLSTVMFFTLMAIGLSLLMDFSWVNVSEAVGRILDRFIIRRIARLTSGEEEEAETKLAAQAEGDLAKQSRAAAVDTESRLPLRIIKPKAATTEKAVLAPRADAPRPERAESAADSPRPSLGLLDDPDEEARGVDEETIGMTSRLIVSKLKSYNIEAAVMSAQPGPVITQYWLEPGAGVKGSQIENARDDLRRALGVQAVRVVLSVPGTSYIALEVPNPVRQTVRLKEILQSEAYETSKSLLTLAIGKDIAGRPFVMDLAKTPHLLVAGTTGSGKSVGINAMILSMLYRTDPSQLRLVLIDPKMLEFSLYNGIPHLLCPVVTDMNKAATALKWLTREMDNRYAVMSRIGVRHFTSYNERVREAIERGQPIRDPMAAPDDPLAGTLEPWPYIVCVVDELADLMLTNRKEVEGEITRLTQKARAAGIHLILATQRPSVDVVTSLIKANVPTRISFQVASAIDSRVILGEPGAEQLLGYGDLLLHRPGEPGAKRVQGCFVADGEVQRVVEELKKYGSPSYVADVTESLDPETAGDDAGGSRRSGETDPLYDQAVQVVLSEKRASISFVQRHLGIGYNRAANILEAMEEAGIVSKASATGKRSILVNTEH